MVIGGGHVIVTGFGGVLGLGSKQVEKLACGSK
jgi:hypothetical protein